MEGDVTGIGPLVWARRRNGSWWPGRILKMDEVPPGNMIANKSGTPVELLGRDDAIVEWYNLEKSIRVKAFRCGEFDDCIEKAEASHSAPIRRREKYARREDAILHALELEREIFGTKQHKPRGIVDKERGVMEREMVNWSFEKNSKKSGTAESSHFGSNKDQMGRRALSMLEDSVGNASHMHTGRYGQTFSMEESIPQTGGLQDFDLRITPPKTKEYEFGEWDSFRKPVDSLGDGLPSAGESYVGAHHVGKNSSTLRRKSLHGGMLEDSPAKRQDRRMSLHRVLENSAALSPFHSFPNVHDVGNIPVRAKRSSCIYLPADSNDSDHVGYSFKSQIRQDSVRHYHDSRADQNMSSGREQVHSDSSEKTYSETGVEEEPIIQRDPKVLLPDIGRHVRNSPTAPEIHHPGSIAEVACELGDSKWHMKGKRNIRSSTKSTVDGMDVTTCNSADKGDSSLEGTSYENKGAGFMMRRTDHSSQLAVVHGEYSKREFNTCDEEDFPGQDTTLLQSVGLSNQRYPTSFDPARDQFGNFNDSDDDPYLMQPSGWDGDRNYHAIKNEASYSHSDHLCDDTEPMLVGVELKVLPSYKGEHVPLVSLMSRLNGKAIIGHPVQVEILEDGSSDLFVSRTESSFYESTAPSQVWKTARRTATQRTPRPNRAPSALEDEDYEPLLDSDLEGSPPMKKAYSRNFGRQSRLAKKRVTNVRRSASGKFLSNPMKNVIQSGQKVRMMSSFSVEQRRNYKAVNREPNKGRGILGGLTKADGILPRVTCVPAKVVFSRIFEALGKPPSSVTNRIPVADSTMIVTS